MQTMDPAACSQRQHSAAATADAGPTHDVKRNARITSLPVQYLFDIVSSIEPRVLTVVPQAVYTVYPCIMHGRHIDTVCYCAADP